jgi:hypothetical protein
MYHFAGYIFDVMLLFSQSIFCVNARTGIISIQQI